MNRIRHVPVVLLMAATAAAAACSSQSESATAGAQESGRPPVAVTIAPVERASFEQSVDIVGTLAPKFSADVKSEITGIVAAVYVTEWVPVRKGDRLARLDATETEAGLAALRAGEAQAKVAESRAAREYERAQQLQKYGLITPQAFDDAKTAVEAAQAATEAAAAQRRAAEARLAKATILAPMDGVVALRGVSVGDRVENMGSGEPLFRIVDNRLLDLTVAVPATDLSEVKVGQPSEFTTVTVPGRTFTGKVKFINPTIDASNRSAKVVVEVPNRDGLLRGGAFVEGRIIVATRADILQVPREALLNWDLGQQSADVYLAKAGKAEKRTVRTGQTNGDLVEIVSGLEAGDPVVTRGGFSLQPGDPVVAGNGEGA